MGSTTRSSCKNGILLKAGCRLYLWLQKYAFWLECWLLGCVNVMVGLQIYREPNKTMEARFYRQRTQVALVSLLDTAGDGVAALATFLKARMKSTLQHRIEWIIYVAMAAVLVCLIASIFIVILLE